MKALEEEGPGSSGLGAFFGRSEGATGGGGTDDGPQRDDNAARRRCQAEELAEQDFLSESLQGGRKSDSWECALSSSRSFHGHTPPPSHDPLQAATTRGLSPFLPSHPVGNRVTLPSCGNTPPSPSRSLHTLQKQGG